MQIGIRFISSSGLSNQRHLVGWGSGLSGELGLGEQVQSIKTPVGLWWEDGNSAPQLGCIAAGDSFSLFGPAEGGLFSCGSGGQGQTGRSDWDERRSSSEEGIRPSSALSSNSPTSSATTSSASILSSWCFDAISCGRFHALLRTSAQDALLSMGSSVNGQLGNLFGSPSWRAQPLPVLSGRVGPFCCGWTHSLACADGLLYAWGHNHRFQLGLGHDFPVAKPRPVPLPPHHARVSLLAAGMQHSLAVCDDGRAVLGWGMRGPHGWLLPGDPSLQAVKQPSLVLRPESPVVSVSAGRAHSLVALASGEVLAWGSNDRGQLGLGNSAPAGTAAPSRVALPVGERALSVHCGADFSVATTDTGSVYAWGHGADGQMGAPQPLACNTVPQRIACFEGKRILHLAVGFRHILCECEEM